MSVEEGRRGIFRINLDPNYTALIEEKKMVQECNDESTHRVYPTADIPPEGRTVIAKLYLATAPHSTRQADLLALFREAGYSIPA